MAKTWAQKEPLVDSHISGVSVRVIEKYLRSFRTFIGHQKSGIYVLRKDQDIYYVGLASSLRGRLQDHIKDHHRGKWDEFDLYIIRKGKTKYLKELEALLIRVAKPPGNANEPRFVRHNNVTKKLERALTSEVVNLFRG
jgi:hypothetical protein